MSRGAATYLLVQFELRTLQFYILKVGVRFVSKFPGVYHSIVQGAQ